MMDKKPHIKPYLYGMLAGFGAIALSIIFFFLIYRFDGFGSAISTLTGILMPFIYGAVIAYLLKPVCNSIENFLRRFIPEKMNGLITAMSVTPGCEAMALRGPSSMLHPLAFQRFLQFIRERGQGFDGLAVRPAQAQAVQQFAAQLGVRFDNRREGMTKIVFRLFQRGHATSTCHAARFNADDMAMFLPFRRSTRLHGHFGSGQSEHRHFDHGDVCGLGQFRNVIESTPLPGVHDHRVLHLRERADACLDLPGLRVFASPGIAGQQRHAIPHGQFSQQRFAVHFAERGADVSEA